MKLTLNELIISRLNLSTLSLIAISSIDKDYEVKSNKDISYAIYFMIYITKERYAMHIINQHIFHRILGLKFEVNI